MESCCCLLLLVLLRMMDLAMCEAWIASTIPTVSHKRREGQKKSEHKMMIVQVEANHLMHIQLRQGKRASIMVGINKDDCNRLRAKGN